MARKTKTVQKRGPQERGLKTFDKIVTAAIELVSESDIGSVRFADISKKTKIPPPLVNYHFPSLQALQWAMIQHELQKLMELSLHAIESQQKKPRKALEAYILAPFNLAEKDMAFRAVWTGYYHLITVQEKVAMFNTSVQTTGHERIMNLLNALLISEKLKFKKNKTAALLASTVQGIIAGYGISAATHIKNDFRMWSRLAIDDITDLVALSTTPIEK
jgi:AcrR family transcriptional regulator